jgi:acyl-CoA reductase-like NAD-dependent aldehyde dehydrogenase
MSQDIWEKGRLADFVATPHSVAEAVGMVQKAHADGTPLNPRGAGMSYTNGYTPDRDGVGILDFSKLDRIVEINTDDMYVTVEAGCTWKTLYEALRPLNVRTPFWGPLSGISSTIGGGLSQNNAFFGAGIYGTTADSVLSVTVILEDGTLVRTGTAANRDGRPFWRHYGPDLTGLFLGDAGALGHKVEATLRLIPLPEVEDYASFTFSSRDACAATIADLARDGTAAEIFAFDPELSRVRLKRASLASDMGTLGKVVGKQGSVLKGLKEGVRVAMAGRGFLGQDNWSLHYVVEGRDEGGVAAGMKRLARICERHGAKAAENSIPKIIRANPFTPLNNMLGPQGERWVPIHGIVSMQDGPRAWAEIEQAFDSMRGELDTHKIQTGFLVTTLGTTGYLIEPVFIWPEERWEIHENSVEPQVLKRFSHFASNPTATETVRKARQAVLDVFERYGAAHFQVGRTYPYTKTMAPETRALLERVKRAVDPEGRVNPGALGLAAAPRPLPVRDPRTGEIDHQLIPATQADIKNAVHDLRRHQPDWAELPIEARGDALTRLADALAEESGPIVAALSRDTGRNRIARMEVEGVRASIAAWVSSIPDLTIDDGWTQGRSDPRLQHRPQFIPYPLVGVISPWNFPLTLSMIDTIPALLAGCSVIVKPSEVTPRFAAPLRVAIERAGLANQLRFIDGGGQTGADLVRLSDAVCFTGSVATGRKVAVAAAERLIPAFLELGGKDPLLVLDGADVERATDAALRGSVLATGQACQSIERIYVARALHDGFVDRLVAKAEAVDLNWPSADRGQIGPIIFDRQADILRSQIDDARSRGAQVRTGGTIETHGGGLWLRPTVLTGVTHEMEVMREETFGPIMPVMAFDTVEEAIALATDTVFGLSAAVFGPDLEAAEAVGRRIEAGAVSLNDAALTSLFYEAEKQSFRASGLGGSRMGRAGYQRFLRRKALIANTGTPTPLSAFGEDPS